MELLKIRKSVQDVAICFVQIALINTRKRISKTSNYYFSTCPNRCSAKINVMTSKALLGIYNDLDIKCNRGCGKTIKLIDLPKH